ncbi:hypothetical protein EYF80_053870 [Liparis tanakae]|uniref:Uncharacterized protein n=1 Tax=Liparis tanakae TaxID=230148 RepID=A0A4Z2F4E2_9TELE|nr:hypothetical protein EYF80_053870 [Liparis tanakae]
METEREKQRGGGDEKVALIGKKKPRSGVEREILNKQLFEVRRANDVSDDRKRGAGAAGGRSSGV